MNVCCSVYKNENDFVLFNQHICATIYSIMNNNLGKFNVGYLYIILTAVIWSTGGFLIKLIDASPIFIAFGRSFVAGVFFLPWIKFKKIRICKELVILSLSYTICLTTFVLATRLTTAANAIAIQYTAPLFLFLGLFVFKREFNKSKLLPITIIFIAIIVFLIEPKTGSNVYGNLLALLSGITFASTIYYFGFDYGISSTGLTGLLNLLLLPLIAFFVPWNVEIFPKDAVSIIALLFLGIIQIGLAYMFFNKGRRTVDALNASIICLIEMVLNPIFVLIIIGEIPTIYAFIGISLIIIGQFLNVMSEKRSRVA